MPDLRGLQFYLSSPIWFTLNPRAKDALGAIPSFLTLHDPRPAREQFNDAYAHGGGWRPFEGFALENFSHRSDNTGKAALLYPGDPPTPEIARCILREETIILFAHSWVAIVQRDGAFEVSRMD